MSRASQVTGRGPVTISTHAALRWVQRVRTGGSAPQAVREAFRRASRVRRPEIDGDAFLDPESDVLLVVRGSTVVTLWREVAEAGGDGA